MHGKQSPLPSHEVPKVSHHQLKKASLRSILLNDCNAREIWSIMIVKPFVITPQQRVVRHCRRIKGIYTHKTASDFSPVRCPVRLVSKKRSQWKTSPSLIDLSINRSLSTSMIKPISSLLIFGIIHQL